MLIVDCPVGFVYFHVVQNEIFRFILTDPMSYWSDPEAESAANNLKREEAELRHSLLDPQSVQYTLSLDLSQASNEYSGKLFLKFNVVKGLCTQMV